MNLKPSVIVYAALLACLAANTLGIAYAEEKRVSAALTFQYDPQVKELNLTQQKVVPRETPKNRSRVLQPGTWRVDMLDASGHILSKTHIADPTLIYADWPVDPESSEPGLLTGTQVQLEEAEFSVVVPFEMGLSRAVIRKPRFNAERRFKRFERIGSLGVDRSALIQQYQEVMGHDSAKP
ncbi:MAG: hypothetical protein HYY14_05185 [Candidatus Omnitrophica bacterium]|nr:hypothetical protein [Candidatus Omnitrophota bacterium]